MFFTEGSGQFYEVPYGAHFVAVPNQLTWHPPRYTAYEYVSGYGGYGNAFGAYYPGYHKYGVFNNRFCGCVEGKHVHFLHYFPSLHNTNLAGHIDKYGSKRFQTGSLFLSVDEWREISSFY